MDCTHILGNFAKKYITMINRILIRIKVTQILYSYLTKDEKIILKVKKELQKSLDKSYELYNSLLQLMIDLTAIQDLRLDEAKHKFLPSEEDLNPNTRFVDNQFIKKLACDPTLREFIKDNKITWRDDELFLNLMLDKVLNSEEYKLYMDMEATDWESDCEIWHQLLKKVILVDDDLLEYLENKSVYWCVDDLDIMGQFVMKTVRKFESHSKSPIFPQFKDEEDSIFGEQLLIKTINHMQANNELIDQFVKDDKWDAERIALMDRIVMCTALTEIQEFSNIPINVSMNEYIEMAKKFSTPNSGQFVNGILNSIIKKLHQEGKLLKTLK